MTIYKQIFFLYIFFKLKIYLIFSGAVIHKTTLEVYNTTIIGKKVKNNVDNRK